MRHATLYFSVIGLAAICLYGCVAAQAKREDKFVLPPPPSTTQPAPPIKIDASQITAQVVAQARQELRADVQAQVNATISTQGIGYTSQFGIGPALIVGSALVLTLWLSHRREMQRLRCRREPD